MKTCTDRVPNDAVMSESMEAKWAATSLVGPFQWSWTSSMARIQTLPHCTFHSPQRPRLHLKTKAQCSPTVQSGIPLYPYS